MEHIYIVCRKARCAYWYVQAEQHISTIAFVVNMTVTFTLQPRFMVQLYSYTHLVCHVIPGVILGRWVSLVEGLHDAFFWEGAMATRVDGPTSSTSCSSSSSSWAPNEGASSDAFSSSTGVGGIKTCNFLLAVALLMGLLLEVAAAVTAPARAPSATAWDQDLTVLMGLASLFPALLFFRLVK